MIKSCKIFLMLLFAVFVYTPAGAAVSVQASVDKTNVSLEDVIELSVVVSGLRSSKEPELGSMKDFQVQSRGSASQIQIINGQMNSSVTYSYYLSPKKMGSYSINPITVRDKGRVYRTNPIRITVVRADAMLADNDRAVFIKTFLSNDNPYINEQIVYTFQLFRSVSVRNLQVQFPEFEHFWKETLGEQKEYRKVINGKTYTVTEIKYALMPSAARVIKIDPVVMQLDVIAPQTRRGRRNDPFFDNFFEDSFFGRKRGSKRKILRSSLLTVTVKPFPKKGKPSDFSGIVGTLRINAKLNSNKIEEGETVTLTVTVSGFGNVNDVKIPPLDLKGNFKVYDDKPEYTQKRINDVIFGQKVMRKALVPLTTGQLLFPEITIPYFNLKKKKYDVLKVPPIRLMVTPSKEKEHLNMVTAQSGGTATRNVRILGQDLLDIHTDLADFQDQRSSGKSTVLFGSLFVFPIFSFGLLSLVQKNKNRLRGDQAYARYSTTYKMTMKQLRKFPQEVEKEEKKERYAQLSKILRGYIGDKLTVSGVALTSKDVEMKFFKKGVNQESIKETVDLLLLFESFQYGAFGLTDDEPSKLRQRVEDVVKMLEKEL